MKKIVAVFMAICIIMMPLSGCGGDSAQSSDPESSAAQEATPTPEAAATPEPTSTPDPTPLQESDVELLPLEITETGFFTTNGFLRYMITLYNPNEDYCVQYPAFRVTARDVSGAVLGSTEQTLSIAYPKEEFVYIGAGFEVEESVASIDVDILTPEEYNVFPNSKLNHPNHVPLTVESVALRGDRVVGEIISANDYELDQAIICVIFRDDNGDFVAGDSAFIHKVPGDSKTPFDISLYGGIEDFATDNFQVYAHIW